MARGPKKHLKRLNAPSHWLLSKMDGIFAPRPSAGPHKMRECLPIVLILRNRLKYALTRRESMMIVMRRLVEIDGKIRTDINYPVGFQDVVRIPKTNEQFRLLFDAKGRFTLHAISDKEAKFKLCRVQKTANGNKASIGRNPFVNGMTSSIPYIVTHDGRTIRYPHPDIKVNDVVKYDIATGRITEFYKFGLGQTAMITKGANSGRIGVIVHREAHPGSHEIMHLRDAAGHEFATRTSAVFVLGNGDNLAVTVPREKGVKKSILEERALRQKSKK